MRHGNGGPPSSRRAAVIRYRRNMIAIDGCATALGLSAWWFIPHPIAVMTFIGSLVTLAAAPFINPIDNPDQEPP